MSTEKYKPTPEEIHKAEESMTEEQAGKSEYREKKEAIREMVLEVLKENPQLARGFANNKGYVRYSMEKNPGITLEQLGSVESFRALPRDPYEDPSVEYEKLPIDERIATPTFEDLRRSLDANVFKDFVVAFSKVAKDKDFYCTVHQPRRSTDASMRLWTEHCDPTLSGHPNWDRSKAVVESWGNPYWTSEIMKELEKELESSGARWQGQGGDFSPPYQEWRMRAKKDKT